MAIEEGEGKRDEERRGEKEIKKIERSKEREDPRIQRGRRIERKRKNNRYRE